MTKVPHDYVAASLGHSNLMCRWCGGTPAENAVIEPNGCSAAPARQKTPFDQAVSVLMGQRWTAEEARQLHELIEIGATPPREAAA